MALGRPAFAYTEELGQEIADAIATSTKGITQLCKEHEHWPGHETVYQWIYKHKHFSDLYASAKAAQQDVLIDYVNQRSCDSTNDTYIGDDGKMHSNLAAIQRDRLIADNYKWTAARLSQRYRDKQQIDSNINVNHESGIKDLA